MPDSPVPGHSNEKTMSPPCESAPANGRGASTVDPNAPTASADKPSVRGKPQHPPPSGKRSELDQDSLDRLQCQSEEFEKATPQEIIHWAAEEFGDGLTMATAFGPEGMAIIHMIWEMGHAIHTFNLDTGYQFPETLAMVDRIREKYQCEIDMRRPEMTIEQFEAQFGGPIYKTDPDTCCGQRKLVVLRQTVADKSAWISAIRRDQSADRAKAAILFWDKRFELVKVNPLANWTKKDVWKFITDNDVPYNPLHDQGYSSIGCQPCTRAVIFGEDERAGRWSGTAKTECGLHTLGESDS